MKNLPRSLRGVHGGHGGKRERILIYGFLFESWKYYDNLTNNNSSPSSFPPCNSVELRIPLRGKFFFLTPHINKKARRRAGLSAKSKKVFLTRQKPFAA